MLPSSVQSNRTRRGESRGTHVPYPSYKDTLEQVEAKIEVGQRGLQRVQPPLQRSLSPVKVVVLAAWLWLYLDHESVIYLLNQLYNGIWNPCSG